VSSYVVSSGKTTELRILPFLLLFFNLKVSILIRMRRFLAIVVLILIALASLGISDTTTIADKGGLSNRKRSL